MSKDDQKDLEIATAEIGSTTDNLQFYNSVREVPAEAQKEIKGGRLSGMTDISPMWRIKKLTEKFGMCGEGWKYEITNQRLASGGDDQIAAFVDINLYYKQGDGWSEPIPGAGGSMFVVKESKGLHTDDDCFKKSLTDALGVACKALGIGANVYWQKDNTKYDDSVSVNDTTIKPKQPEPDPAPTKPEEIPAPDPSEKMTLEEVKEMFGVDKVKEVTEQEDPAEKEKAQRSAIRAMLLELCEGDEEAAKKTLEKMTTFTSKKDGTEVAGKKSVKQLTVKQVPIVFQKVKKEYDDRIATPPAGPDVGDGDNMPLY